MEQREGLEVKIVPSQSLGVDVVQRVGLKVGIAISSLTNAGVWESVFSKTCVTLCRCLRALGTWEGGGVLQAVQARCRKVRVLGCLSYKKDDSVVVEVGIALQECTRVELISCTRSWTSAKVYWEHRRRGEPCNDDRSGLTCSNPLGPLAGCQSQVNRIETEFGRIACCIESLGLWVVSPD